MGFDFLQLFPARQFSDAFSKDFYYPVPDDWWVVTTDVVHSTRAIQAGRYKDINMLGAAGITAVFNLLGGAKIPFVFGGDGASFLCSNGQQPALVDELLAVQHFGRDFFDLELRVGAVPLSQIRKQGKDVLVARLELSPGNNLALFSGGGLVLADQLIKADSTGEYCKQQSSDRLPNLEGLSCRWQPLKPRNGTILTLLIQANEETDYQRVVEDVQGMIERDVEDINPVKIADLKIRKFFEDFTLENFTLSAGRGGFFRPFFLQILTKVWHRVAHWINAQHGPYKPEVYLKELRSNSDFRKFDDMVRMVVDCRPESVPDLRAYLEQKRAEGIIRYGLHLSPEALMTCLVLDFACSQHLHFIDGADGGYAMAAKELKAQY
ncbi:DUF3095 domain-containing protein [Kiloniella laminariae]|uniref:DUF3095 domain-containing protein n=1 Tax=Kiloniella laminariae TaxID=454162 RepID=UPI000360397C|nr:DUF3095 domain-containing protein [Kiloniella laminariae]